MADNRVQLIIEAFNKTKSAWDELSTQVDHAKTDLSKLGSSSAATGTSIAGAGQKAATGWSAISGKIREAINTTESFQLKAGELDGFLAQGIGLGVFFGLLREAKLAIDTVEKTDNSLRGLAATARYSGENIGNSINAGMTIAEDGLINVRDASQSLQNLLSRGFSLNESIDLINRLKDSAAFNRQSHLSMSEAITSATEGLKNENSILVDNAGVTKNVSVMWKEYAKEHQKSVEGLTLAEKRQAEYNGIMKETEAQVGNAKLAIEGITGAKARMSQEVFKLRNALGEGETGMFYVLGNSIVWALTKMREFFGGIEILAVKVASFWDKLSIRKDVALSGKGVFSKEGLAEYEQRVKSITEAEEAQIASIVAKWEGKVSAPEIGKDSGKRRTERVEGESKEEKKKRLDAAKKAEQDAIAEAELAQRTAFGIIDQSREEDHESNKEWLRKRQLLHEEEKIDDAAWIESQRQFKLSEAMINDDAISKKIDVLNAEWEAKSSHYAEGKALDTAYAAYSLQFDKLMLDATKATNSELVANDEARIASAKLKKKTDAETAKAAADLAKAQKTAAYSDAARNLSRVEMDEKSGILSTVEALQKKIEILNDLEAMQQRDLDIMSRNSAEEITAWNSQSQAIEGTRQKLNQYYSDLTQRSPIEGMKRGLRSYADTATNVGAGMESTFTNAFKGMEDALVRFAQTGELNFKDMANSIIADLIRIQIRASITGPLAGALNAGITSFFSGGGSSSGGATPLGLDASTMVAHEGGMILPRFHFGGLATDEVPAILQTRERVLSREQAGLFEKFVNKTEGGAAGNVQVNVINQSGTQVSAEQSQPRFDGDQMIVDVILRKLQASPGFRNAMAGGF